MLILTIAILSLTGLIIGILFDCFMPYRYLKLPTAKSFIGAIAVLSWWDICFPLAVTLLVISSLWLLICFYAWTEEI